jgi:hypothetical protein
MGGTLHIYTIDHLIIITEFISALFPRIADIKVFP